MAALEIRQVQKQSQSLVLAPQLRQSLKILQLPSLELRNAVLEELQINPTLEEFSIDDSFEEKLNGEDRDLSQDVTSDNIDVNPQEIDFENEYEKLLNFADDWNEYDRQNPLQPYVDRNIKREHLFNSLVLEPSLQEYVMEQASLSNSTPEVLVAMQHLIGSLDDRGFLKVEWSEIATLAHVSLEHVEEAANLLKTLDPPGIGCKDLKESLLQQLILKKREKSLAFKIIDTCYDLLLRRRIPEIARKLNTRVSDVEEGMHEIARLDPAPARRFSEDQNHVVAPDVTVLKDGLKWHVIMNSDYIPRLRLSPIYKRMVSQGNLNPQEREYIRDKMRSSKFLINSIEQRQNTIERITREILFFQKDFFERGVAFLQPMTMNRIAESLGIHETTVCRAIAHKYVETPHGLFPFHYFFTSGYESSNGQSFSNTSIKEDIKHIIESESPTKPYSDQEIVKILAEKDIHIARRTVAKYRDELGILPTNLRRKYS